MAKKSRQSFMKRQRERDRQERAALKRQKRAERGAGDEEGEEGATPVEEEIDMTPVNVGIDEEEAAEIAARLAGLPPAPSKKPS